MRVAAPRGQAGDGAWARRGTWELLAQFDGGTVSGTQIEAAMTGVVFRDASVFSGGDYP